jgi:4-hydroxy-4-methyl-2-oxoglutarate aldolase
MDNPRTKPTTTEATDIVSRLFQFDPATLYEAAGQKGMVDPAIRPAWREAKMCGPAATVECPPGDNLTLHLAVAKASPGVVIVATVGGHLLAGTLGEVLAVAAQVRGVAGFVTDGAVRDIDAIETLGFPVFSRGLAIGACTKERMGRLDVPIQFGGVTVRPGDIVFGDTEGVVIIDPDRIEEVYEAALARRKREEEIIGQLRQGRTTIELLGLADPRGGNEIVET